MKSYSQRKRFSWQGVFLYFYGEFIILIQIVCIVFTTILEFFCTSHGKATNILPDRLVRCIPHPVNTFGVFLCLCRFTFRSFSFKNSFYSRAFAKVLRPSWFVTLCIVAKRYVLEKKLLLTA